MDSLQARLDDLKETVRLAVRNAGRPEESARLIAVSKTFPIDVVAEAAEAGHRLFGENYIQEAAEKVPALRERFSDSEFHFIGSLQSNKARLAVELFDVIQTLDRPKLVGAIEKACESLGCERQRVFIQVNISGEDAKSGVKPAELSNLVDLVISSPRLELEGLMTIGLFPGDVPAEDLAVARKNEFVKLRELSLEEQSRTGHQFPELSMGMSADFSEAIACGATLVRVGSAIFGKRS